MTVEDGKAAMENETVTITREEFERLSEWSWCYLDLRDDDEINSYYEMVESINKRNGNPDVER